jgi:hypothetical protein
MKSMDRRRATALPTRSSGRAATLARHLCLLTPNVSAVHQPFHSRALKSIYVAFTSMRDLPTMD